MVKKANQTTTKEVLERISRTKSSSNQTLEDFAHTTDYKDIYDEVVKFYGRPVKHATRALLRTLKVTILCGGIGSRSTPLNRDGKPKPLEVIYSGKSMIAILINKLLSIGISGDNIYLHAVNASQQKFIADELSSADALKKYGFIIRSANICVQDTPSYPWGLITVGKFAAGKAVRTAPILQLNGDAFFQRIEYIFAGIEEALSTDSQMSVLATPSPSYDVMSKLGNVVLNADRMICYEKPPVARPGLPKGTITANELYDNYVRAQAAADEAAKDPTHSDEILDNAAKELNAKPIVAGNTAVYLIKEPLKFYQELEEAFKKKKIAYDSSLGTKKYLETAPNCGAVYVSPELGFIDLGTQESMLEGSSMLGKLDGKDLITRDNNLLIGFNNQLSSGSRGCNMICGSNSVAANAIGVRNISISTDYSTQRSMPIAVIVDKKALHAIGKVSEIVDALEPGDVRFFKAQPDGSILKVENDDRYIVKRSEASDLAGTIILLDGNAHKSQYIVAWTNTYFDTIKHMVSVVFNEPN